MLRPLDSYRSEKACAAPGTVRQFSESKTASDNSESQPNNNRKPLPGLHNLNQPCDLTRARGICTRRDAPCHWTTYGHESLYYHSRRYFYTDTCH